MISFAWPWLLVALPLPLLVYFLPAKKKVQSAALKIPTLIDGIDGNATVSSSSKLPALLLSLVWLLVVLAASRPQWLGEAVDIPTEGREMMIAVDLSGSMQVEDMNILCI